MPSTTPELTPLLAAQLDATLTAAAARSMAEARAVLADPFRFAAEVGEPLFAETSVGFNWLFEGDLPDDENAGWAQCWRGILLGVGIEQVRRAMLATAAAIATRGDPGGSGDRSPSLGR